VSLSTAGWRPMKTVAKDIQKPLRFHH
jgi:hypothetical protein